PLLRLGARGLREQPFPLLAAKVGENRPRDLCAESAEHRQDDVVVLLREHLGAVPRLELSNGHRKRLGRVLWGRHSSSTVVTGNSAPTWPKDYRNVMSLESGIPVIQLAARVRKSSQKANATIALDV